MLYEKISELELSKEVKEMILQYYPQDPEAQKFIFPKRSKMVLNGTVYIDTENGVYRSVLLYGGNPDDRTWQSI